jgi:hypothetical protein
MLVVNGKILRMKERSVKIKNDNKGTPGMRLGNYY